MILYQKKQLGGLFRLAKRAIKPAAKAMKKTDAFDDYLAQPDHLKQMDVNTWSGFSAPENIGNTPRALGPDVDQIGPGSGISNPFGGFTAPEVGNVTRPNRAAQQFSERMLELEDEMEAIATDWNQSSPESMKRYEQLRAEWHMLNDALNIR
jgi:hypothetical protein